jgi:hypothetical protein
VSPRHFPAAIYLGVAVVASSCAPKMAPLPSAPGSPFPDFASAYESAVKSCRAARTLSAELALSGRAGSQKMRGHILGGFAEPGKVRLEALAFGRPIFVLVAHDGTATLLLNRDRRAVRGAPPEAIVEALAGVALDANDLRTAVTGCGLGTGDPQSGESLGSDWVRVKAGDTTNWLRRLDGEWRLVASTRGPLEVRYDDFSAGRPATVHIRSAQPGGAPAADLTIRLSQVDINTPLESRVFELEIPPGTEPLTIDELRRAGPLGQRGGEDTRRQ